MILLMYSVVLFCLGAFTLDNLELADDKVSSKFFFVIIIRTNKLSCYKIVIEIRNGFYACAAFYIVPLLLAVVLTFGVFRVSCC